VSLKPAVRYAALATASVALAVAMTWPLGRVSPVSIPDVDDAYFSIWRLAWVAHQLPIDPAHLFDANIFHPETGTLAYSDAMLLLGVIALPLFKLSIDPGLVHNTLLLAAIVSSMLCVFALTGRLTGSDRAALLAAIIFGFAPYRMAHIGHLELQWTMWMPLAMLLLHRFYEQPSTPRALLIGAALAAQVLCSIYYGIFLACYLLVAWIALLPFEKSKRRVVTMSAAAVLPLVVVAAIYAPPYLSTRGQFGDRSAGEVRTLSATPADYLRVSTSNWLRGHRESGVAPEERSLFPGAVALLLATLAFIPPISRLTWTYLGLGLVALELSFGSNGVLFPLMQQAFGVAASLRSPSRFGVLVLLSVAVLAGTGASRLFQRLPHHAPAATVILAILCLTEYWSAPLTIRAFDATPSEAHFWLSQQPPGSVVLELPAPTASTLWLYESTYQVRSINHWQPLVNGYSAFAPSRYAQLIDLLKEFPQPHVIEALREVNVKYVLINREYYSAEAFDALTATVNASNLILPPRPFGSGDKQVLVVELKPQS
jgi:hypothetical protein